MRYTTIIIGDEILIGQVTDTNSGEIARALGPKGWQAVETITVPDDGDAIYDAISRAMSQSDLVITTGGLGPTKDDITKQVMLRYFGGELRRDEAVTENIREVFAKRGLQMNALTADQALVPTSCRVIQNRLGTAPIMWFEREGRVLIAMPGVPFETVGMLHRAVLSEIQAHFAADIRIEHRTLIVTGITESALAQRLTEYEECLPEGLHLAYLPTPGLIRLRLDSIGATADIDVWEKRLCMELGELVIHRGDATPAEILLERVRRHGYTVASAESCTGGNIAARITAISGCSDVYLGTVVSYANEVKMGILGVSADDLAQHGAVSREVVTQMAEGVARATGADCTMATSGVAGPGGGTPDKPVGTVWIAVHTPEGTTAECHHFPGDRARVIDRAATTALLMLVSKL